MKRSQQSAHPETFKKIYKEMTKDGLRLSFVANREYTLAKDRYTSTMHDDYMALSLAVRVRIVERWIVTQQCYQDVNAKRVYYF